VGAGPAIELRGGGLGKPTTVTFDQLCSMPFVELDKVLMQRSDAPDQVTSWRGPALKMVLARAQIKPGPMMIAFTATDGYEVEATSEELDSAIVALQDGHGRWLADVDKSCPLRLVAPKLTADFWVQNPARITVEALAAD
jgi:DMSO/TMAO reductase YedYZ molybdopterin-dependent catalytic subunit